MTRSFRAKPVGWRRDNYRHYLAAKGVVTKTPPYKYFATIPRHDLKGNRDGNPANPGMSVKSWYARGYSDEEIPDYVKQASKRSTEMPISGGVPQTFVRPIEREQLQTFETGGIPVQGAMPAMPVQEAPVINVNIEQPKPVQESSMQGLASLPGVGLAPDIEPKMSAEMEPSIGVGSPDIERHENLNGIMANMSASAPPPPPDTFSNIQDRQVQ